VAAAVAAPLRPLQHQRLLLPRWMVCAACWAIQACRKLPPEELSVAAAMPDAQTVRLDYTLTPDTYLCPPQAHSMSSNRPPT
jgi:hypothetical protein